MIKVSITNYTTIKQADFDIQGLTVLRASSNGGKSSIVNAINAGVTSEFSPQALRWGESSAKIALGFHDGSVQLTRNGSTTNYQIATNSGLNESYSKFNRKLPEQVTDFLNLCVVSVGDAPYCMNFHQQFAPPLSLAMSHARFVSFLSSSDLLEEHKATSKKLSSRSYELQGSINSFSGLFTTTQDKLSVKKAQLEAMTTLGTNLDNAFKHYTTVRKSAEVLFTIAGHLDLLQRSRTEKSNKEVLLEKLNSLSELVSKSLEIQTKLGRLAFVQSKQQDLRVYTEKSKAVKGLLSVVASLEDSATALHKAKNDMSVLNALSSHSHKLQYLNKSLIARKDLLERLTTVSNASNEVETSKGVLKTLESLKLSMSQLESLTKTRSDKQTILDNNLCPMCSSPLGSHSH